MNRNVWLFAVLLIPVMFTAILAQGQAGSTGGSGGPGGEVDLGLKGIGINVGYLMVANGFDGCIGFGGEVDFGSLVKPDGDKNKIMNVRLRADIEYWKAVLPNPEGVTALDTKLSDFSISVGPKLRFQIPDAKINPFIFAELGMHFTSLTAEHTSDSKNLFQFRVGAGAEWLVSEQFIPTLHVRLNVGDTNTFGVFGGVIYRF